MEWFIAAAIAGGLVYALLRMERALGREQERLKALIKAMDAGKERAHVEAHNRRLSDDDLRNKLRADRNR